MPLGTGAWELLIVLLVVVLVFGPRRVPEKGRQLGSGLREFKETIYGLRKCQVLRTRRPTGLDWATLTWERANVKCKPRRIPREPALRGEYILGAFVGGKP